MAGERSAVATRIGRDGHCSVRAQASDDSARRSAVLAASVLLNAAIVTLLLVVASVYALRRAFLQ